MSHYEETIFKRWASKSRNKRKALLCKAWPDMPLTHRPDMESWHHLDNGGSLRGEDALALMWPTLNAEDLSNKEPLLLMLHQRARYPPDKFSGQDTGSLNFNIRVGITGQVQIPGYFAVTRARTTPETYGKLYTWEDDDDEVKSEPSCGWIGAADSCWVVEVQSQIYWFLNGICQLILHDVSLEELYSKEECQLQPDLPQLLSKTNPDGVEILSTLAFEDQYKALGNADFSRIVDLIGCKLASAEDHIWAMREDPSYLVFTTKDRMQHLPEMVADADGNPGPPLGLSQDMLWGRAFNQHIKEAIANVDFFHNLFVKVTRLNELVVAQGELLTNKPLPPLIEHAPYHVAYALLTCSIELSNFSILGPSIFSSPLLRETFYRTNEEMPSGYAKLCPRDPDISDSIRNRLLWLLITFADRKNRFTFGARGLVAELDLFARQEPEARALISPFVASQVSTLGILFECISQIELFRPWIVGYMSYYAQNREQLEKNWAQDHSHITNIHNLRGEFWEQKAKLLKTDSKGEYVYLAYDSPTPTKEEIEERRSAELHLDEFWAATTRGLKSMDAISPYIQNLSYEVARTAPWVEPPKAAKKGKKKSNIPSDPLDQLLDEAIAETKKMSLSEKNKSAAKTPGSDAEGAAAATLTIEVNKRALKVFKAILFRGVGGTALAKGVQWNDFVYALTSVGFTAEKLFLSGWVFTPRDESKVTHPFLPIYFDEPYMGGEIHCLIARFYGRRLCRTFGWESDTFKLAAQHSKGGP
ncbi:hypothetical protein F4781DRAFT_387648 [Annulohypoxylon bovei var. microspora]|nr:hypothetical protein F4781DRAFT_387648 [Annulohypoxylon bovei var. microspora]